MFPARICSQPLVSAVPRTTLEDSQLLVDQLVIQVSALVSYLLIPPPIVEISSCEPKTCRSEIELDVRLFVVSHRLLLPIVTIELLDETE